MNASGKTSNKEEEKERKGSRSPLLSSSKSITGVIESQSDNSISVLYLTFNAAYVCAYME